VIDEFVKTMEELAPEEDNLRHLRGAQEAFGEERYDQCITKAGKVSPRSKHLGNARRLQSAAYFYRAIAAAKKKNLTKAEKDKAEKDIRKALELNDNPEEREIISQRMEAIVEGDNIRYLNEAQEAMEAEKYDKCIQVASSVSSESKYISHAHRLQSLAYFRRGIDAAKQEHFDQAEADLKKSLELNDDASERQAIQEQIDALGDAKLGGKLQQAFENGDWRTAERILRDELKKNPSRKVKKQIESQLSLIVNQRGVQAANYTQSEEQKFGKALELVITFIKHLQQQGSSPGSYGYNELSQNTSCPVCFKSQSSWEKGMGDVVQKVILELVGKGSFSADGVTQFWQQHKENLCHSCQSDLQGILNGKREAIKLLEEAVKLDSSNTAAKQNLAALKKAL